MIRNSKTGESSANLMRECISKVVLQPDMALKVAQQDSSMDSIQILWMMVESRLNPPAFRQHKH